MSKFIYTISDHARIIIIDAGTLPINVVHWLTYKKFFNAEEISFCQGLFSLIGYRCKLEIEYVSELIDVSCEVVCASSASTKEKARNMLFHIIPKRQLDRLKNADKDNDARKLYERYQSNASL